jgi:hypothetical protein
MKCWKCGKEASGTCVFCGRGICTECAQSFRNVKGFAAQGPSGPWSQITEEYDAVIIENALWCGLCQIKTVRDDDIH